MNKKGFSMFVIVLIILVALVIIGGIGYYEMHQSGAHPSIVNQNATTTQSETSTDIIQSSNLILRKDWGVSFVKPSNWDVSNTTVAQTELTEMSGEWPGDIMTIQYITGNSITDSDAKFGNVTYWYDETSGKWMVEGISDLQAMDGPTSTREANSEFIVAGDLPVFLGRGRWLTYLIPLSDTSFLKLNITGSGATQPLTDLAKSIQKD